MKYLLCNCFFLLIILVFAYVNTMLVQGYAQKDVAEAFTPKMREFYRPYTRNARLISEGFYNKHTSALSNLFRKFGIV